MNYADFLARKAQLGGEYGFDPSFIPNGAFDFQTALIEWAARKGRAGIFADCGLGKTMMQLAWAENVVRHTGGKALIATPLAVSHQTVDEALKFVIDARRSIFGSTETAITFTNYERLHRFNRDDFAGVVLDESSILKSYDGKRRAEITEFMRRMPYRLLCTATAAPNDYTELGTSSEALGELGHMDMLGRFFKNDKGTVDTKRLWARNGGGQPQWRFKGHAEQPFWRWISSWSRALRRPSDMGFEDRGFDLPQLTEDVQIVSARTLADGMLLPLPAVGLAEQREERKRTIVERCERVAALVNHGEPAIIWCHLNAEGDLLAEMIRDGRQVSGSDDDDAKEGKLTDFAKGNLRVLITKPKIGAWGLNFQHCNHVVYFPSHSYEQYYLAVRRCWRFGQ